MSGFGLRAFPIAPALLSLEDAGETATVCGVVVSEYEANVQVAAEVVGYGIVIHCAQA
jgi:hypothetical protein